MYLKINKIQNKTKKNPRDPASANHLCVIRNSWWMKFLLPDFLKLCSSHLSFSLPVSPSSNRGIWISVYLLLFYFSWMYNLIFPEEKVPSHSNETNFKFLTEEIFTSFSVVNTEIDIQNISSTPESSLCLLPLNISPKAATLLICFTMSFPCSGLHKNGIKEHIFLHVWLISYHIMSLRFIYVLPLCNTSLFFLCSSTSYKYTTIYPFYYWLMNFCIFVNMSQVVMNILAHVFGKHMHSPLLSIIQEMELLGHIG